MICEKCNERCLILYMDDDGASPTCLDCRKVEVNVWHKWHTAIFESECHVDQGRISIDGVIYILEEVS